MDTALYISLAMLSSNAAHAAETHGNTSRASHARCSVRQRTVPVQKLHAVLSRPACVLSGATDLEFLAEWPGLPVALWAVALWAPLLGLAFVLYVW